MVQDQDADERAFLVDSIAMLKAKPRTNQFTDPANEPDAMLLAWPEETLREFDAQS